MVHDFAKIGPFAGPNRSRRDRREPGGLAIAAPRLAVDGKADGGGGALRRVSMVVAEHPAESLTTAHGPERPRRSGQRRDDCVAESLVIPLGVVRYSPTARRRESSPKKIIRSRHSDLIERMILSIHAFGFGNRGGRRTGSIPASANGVRNAVVNLASRSVGQNRFSRKRPSTGSDRGDGRGNAPRSGGEFDGRWERPPRSRIVTPRSSAIRESAVSTIDTRGVKPPEGPTSRTTFAVPAKGVVCRNDRGRTD